MVVAAGWVGLQSVATKLPVSKGEGEKRTRLVVETNPESDLPVGTSEEKESGGVVGGSPPPVGVPPPEEPPLEPPDQRLEADGGG